MLQGVSRREGRKFPFRSKAPSVFLASAWGAFAVLCGKLASLHPSDLGLHAASSEEESDPALITSSLTLSLSVSLYEFHS